MAQRVTFDKISPTHAFKAGEAAGVSVCSDCGAWMQAGVIAEDRIWHWVSDTATDTCQWELPL